MICEHLTVGQAARFLMIVAGAICNGLPAGAASQHDLQIEKLETVYRFEADGTGQTTTHVRWKVITAAGRSRASQFSIPYENEFEDVQVNFFRTLKKDGTTVEGDLTQVFERTAPGPYGVTMFADEKIKTFVPPNVEVGDLFEYEFVQHSKKSLKGNDFWLMHYQERSVPVVSETVLLDLPADVHVALHENSDLPHKNEVRDGRRIESWELANPEPASTLDTHFEPVFAVSTILSWDAFGEWIRGLNEPSEQPTPEIRALAAKLTAGKTTERDRINALYAYVSEKIRYVSINFGVGRYQPHAASEVLKNAYGDCKDKHALLASLLRAVGIKADAVLITPGIGVLEPDVPVPSQFVHEFTRIETSQGPVFLDATLELAPPQVLAPGMRGKKALLFGADKSSIIDIPAASPIPTLDRIKLNGRIDADGRLTGTSRIEFEGADEPEVRRIFRDGTKEQQEQLVRAVSGTQSWRATIGEIRHSDPEDLERPFWLEYSLSDRAFLPPDETSKRITLLGGGTVDPKSLTDREHPTEPIPVEKRDLEMSIDLQIASSYVITNDMPVHMSAPFGSYDSESGYDQGHLRLNRKLKFTGEPIDPADWTRFTSFWTNVAEVENRGFLLERNRSRPVVATNPRTGSDRLSDLLRSGSDALRIRSFEAAQSAYEEAIRLEPRSYAAWGGLGRTRIGLRDLDKAAEAFQRQLEVNPRDSAPYNNLGFVRRAQGRYNEAVVLFRKRLESAPRDAYAHNNLTATLASQKKWDEAVKEGSLAAEIDPKNASVWVLLGRVQANAGHIEDARRSFEHAMEASNDPMIRNSVAYQMVEAKIDLAKAWELVSSAISGQANNICHPTTATPDGNCATRLYRLASALDTAGWALFAQGKPEQAKTYIAASYAVAPGYEIALHLAAVLSKLGEADRALELLVAARSTPVLDSSPADAVQSELANQEADAARFEARLAEAKRRMPLLGEIPVSADWPDKSANGTYRMLALVDENGKVLDAVMESGDEPISGLLAYGRRLTLPPLSWPGAGFRSVRTIELRFALGELQRILSYVVRPPQTSSIGETVASVQ
ncbi:MAG: DUF3857 domain-containing protein [Acidobacteriia bacterium]|nr:DUF3857 domain-containing protein [Terriglobia bacterium]